jgi:peptidoglycan-associated lipoprotein
MGEVNNSFLGNQLMHMKKLNLLGVFITSAVVLISSSGCHRKPSSLTPIPGVTGPSMPDNNNVNPGSTVNTQPAPTSDTGNGMPISYGNYAAVINGPHKEDRDKFQNDVVYFEFDRANIKASEESKLQDVAAYFKNNTSMECLQIEGNCDERGTEKYNLSLGERRALAAREYLANLGVDPQRIKTITNGKSKPADPGHDDAAWKKNRRDEFILLSPER